MSKLTSWLGERANRVELPWEFSEQPDPAKGVIPNEPTELGRELGRHAARLTMANQEEHDRLFPNARPMCRDCAFREGSLPNGCEETIMDAIKCVAESVPFYCHHGLREDEPTRLCAGWAMASLRPRLFSPLMSDSESST